MTRKRKAMPRKAKAKKPRPSRAKFLGRPKKRSAPVLHHRRLRDFEVFDEVRFRVVPRYKTSGLSGDGWRHSVKVQLLFKGLVVAEKGFGDMKAALRLLDGALIDYFIPNPQMDLEEKSCDQPSCKRPWVSKYRLKRLYSRDGHLLDKAELYGDEYRKFCVVHNRRGNCDSEDQDSNYVLLEGPGPDEGDEPIGSPAVFAGVIGEVPE